MLLRREEPDDVDAVQAVVAAAFARPDAPGNPVEVGLLAALRRDPGWIPALSLVAVDTTGEGPGVAGHVVCTRGRVGGHPALGLGPLAVRPDRQGRGVGSALMHAVLGAADALDEPLVALLGSPGYYSRFGFQAAADYAVAAPDPAWGGYFQIRTLSAFRPVEGTSFSYAEPFARL